MAMFIEFEQNDITYEYLVQSLPVSLSFSFTCRAA